jgi:NADH-quinone oxidoreductase subunit A|uniref:NADH-ubiquinone oxidoreductase chain 3 n=1 Tax=Asterionella formosa TaxID=210441 RepID=A0A1J0RDC8_9STRA|nr:NADH dehydrogenase subunit 3 [Asterionella formosa]APD75849.1 NADH dehydrogenase subunit 3 [Asterionella formosa]
MLQNLFETTVFFNNVESLLRLNYITIVIYLVVALLLSLIIINFSFLLVIQNPETEKLSSYECGFEPYEDARHQFDVKFYLIAILFVVFDVETMFLLPWSICLVKLNSLGFWSMIDFVFELGIGFIYVWYVGGLCWKKV